VKKILIAIDYNTSAEKVAEAGYALGKALNAEITIAHVFSEPAYYAAEYSPITGYQGGYTEGTLALVKDIKKEAGEFLAATVKRLGDPGIKTKALAGDIDNSILKYCKSQKIDLIIIGSHSHNGLARLFVTDVAAHFLRHSKIPLFIIPTSDK
jgi:nucleotide-binding universal stress UspA family protein